MCSQKFKKKNPFLPRDKNDQICTTALHIHDYNLWFSYAFRVCSKSMSEIWYNHPLIVVGAVITHKMFDTWTKHLSATDGQLKVFLGPCGWRNSIFKSPSCTFTSVTMPTHQIYHRYNWHMKITWCFSYLFLWSMICWNQIEETLSLLTCELVSNFVARYWYKMVATPCSRHGLWLCKAILQVCINIDHFFLTYTGKCDGKNFSYT